METINIDDFLKIKIKIGKILEAEHLEQSNKLLKLKVDFGNDDIRTVLSGISK
jgi:methionyl-tRNA synthetase